MSASAWIFTALFLESVLHNILKKRKTDMLIKKKKRKNAQIPLKMNWTAGEVKIMKIIGSAIADKKNLMKSDAEETESILWCLGTK